MVYKASLRKVNELGDCAQQFVRHSMRAPKAITTDLASPSSRLGVVLAVEACQNIRAPDLRKCQMGKDRRVHATFLPPAQKSSQSFFGEDSLLTERIQYGSFTKLGVLFWRPYVGILDILVYIRLSWETPISKSPPCIPFMIFRSKSHHLESFDPLPSPDEANDPQPRMPEAPETQQTRRKPQNSWAVLLRGV